MAKAQTRIVKMNEARHMVITPVARVSFPQVFTPKSFQDEPDGKKSFQVDLIFDSKEAFKEAYNGKKKQTPSMMKVVLNAKSDQWGPDKEKWPNFPHKLFKDGNDRTNKDGEVLKGYEDKVFITAKSGEKFPPKVLDRAGNPITEKEFYGGCYAQAVLLARPYDFGGNKGVRFLLLQLMKVKDGERFGGISEDVFDVSEIDEMDDEGGNDSDDEGEDF